MRMALERNPTDQLAVAKVREEAEFYANQQITRLVEEVKELDHEMNVVGWKATAQNAIVVKLSGVAAMTAAAREHTDRPITKTAFAEPEPEPEPEPELEGQTRAQSEWKRSVAKVTGAARFTLVTKRVHELKREVAGTVPTNGAMEATLGKLAQQLYFMQTTVEEVKIEAERKRNSAAETIMHQARNRNVRRGAVDMSDVTEVRIVRASYSLQ